MPCRWTGTIGFVVRLAAEGTRPGDRLVWAYGSTLQGEGRGTSTSAPQKQWYQEGFAPEECRDTLVGTGENGLFTLAIPPANESPRRSRRPKTDRRPVQRRVRDRGGRRRRLEGPGGLLPAARRPDCPSSVARPRWLANTRK